MAIASWVLSILGAVAFTLGLITRGPYWAEGTAIVVFAAGLLLGARALQASGSRRGIEPESSPPATSRATRAGVVYGRVVAPAAALVVGLLGAVYCFGRAVEGEPSFNLPAVAFLLLALAGAITLLAYLRGRLRK